MTDGAISVSADEWFADDDNDGSGRVYGFERVRVAFPAEDGYEPRCKFCGETIEDDYKCGWSTGVGGYVCDENPKARGRHEPESGPGTWCNSAAIRVDDNEDSVTVSISVGDPRGAFTFTVRRIPEDSTGEHAGRLVMHVPFPGEGWPHMELTALHDGTFLIGGTS